MDNKSETFVLEFDEKKEFEGFCKVDFPLEGELFEDGKSEFKALLDVLYKVKTMFNRIEITDDYALAESYWNSKKFNFNLRELTNQEDERVSRLYNEGYCSHEALLRAIMAEDMQIPYEEFMDYINFHIQYFEFNPKIVISLESYLYETAEFCKEGRLCDAPFYRYYDLSSMSFSVFAFILGISWIFWDGTGKFDHICLEKDSVFGPKDAQVGVFFRERFAPLYLAEEDPLEKCILSYRYFLSVYEFLGFHYVGRMEQCKSEMEKVIEEYGEEKGKLFLTWVCTSEKWVFPCFTDNSQKKYGKNFVNNIRNRYGNALFLEYVKFKKSHEQNLRFRLETKITAKLRLGYVDDSLVCS